MRDVMVLLAAALSRVRRPTGKRRHKLAQVANDCADHRAFWPRSARHARCSSGSRRS